MTTKRPLRVFLCHSSADKPAVRELYKKLTAFSIDVWLDEMKLIPGQQWKLEIPKAVREADVVIICLSKTSVTKEGYVQKEIKFALDVALEKPEGTIYLIPARLEECKVPDSLNDWHWVDLFEAQGFDNILKSLRARADSLSIAIKLATQRPNEDPLFDQAVEIARNKGLIAPAMLQKRLGIGYTHATFLIDEMGDKGIISKSEDGTQLHRVLGFEDKSVERSLDLKNPLTLKPISPANAPYENKIILSNGMEFMRVPAGSFLMGSKKDNKLSFDREFPQHVVDINYDYWMARFLVTKEQYSQFKKNDFEKDENNHPVVQVSWNEAVAYCDWLNNQVKKDLPMGLIIRLPTESEWEKSSRGTNALEYPWGYNFDENKCNTYEGEKGNTTPVGWYSPQDHSPYGCTDMSGNAWEWTHSLFMPYPYQFDDGRENGKVLGARVLRGGSFSDVKKRARCAYRIGYPIDYSDFSVSFRMVLAPPIDHL